MYPLPPQVNTALALLNQAGFEAFVVGGAVRDLLRGSPVHDWDITTSALPEQTKTVFADYRLIETGIRHGTVTVLLDGTQLEITTYRTEGTYSDHRRPDNVEFTRSLEEDLARRDFTVNAMAYHPKAGVVDLFDGQNDLKNRIMRCVGEPDKRFQEDALRMLRALRFASRFGFTIEPETSAAIHRNRNLLTHVAAERIRDELTGLLCGYGADTVLRDYPDVFSVLIPELDGRNSYDLSVLPPDPILRWAALLASPEFSHETILRRLRLDNATREDVLFLAAHRSTPLQSREEVRRAVQQFGVHRTGLLLRLSCPPEQADGLLAGITQVRAADLAVNGNDLMAFGLSGAQIGQALDALVNAVVFDGVENKKEALLSYLAKHP